MSNLRSMKVSICQIASGVGTVSARIMGQWKMSIFGPVFDFHDHGRKGKQQPNKWGNSRITTTNAGIMAHPPKKKHMGML